MQFACSLKSHVCPRARPILTVFNGGRASFPIRPIHMQCMAGLALRTEGQEGLKINRPRV